MICVVSLCNGIDTEKTEVTCTYDCKSDGSCSHKTVRVITTQVSGGTSTKTETQTGTCVSPQLRCIGGKCCAGVTDECGECRDTCNGATGQLIKVDGSITSNTLSGGSSQNEPATSPTSSQAGFIFGHLECFGRVQRYVSNMLIGSGVFEIFGMTVFFVLDASRLSSML